MAYEDLGGRINAEHLTPEEWALLEKAANLKDWFIPTDNDWLAVRGVLALVDIRRGYKEEQAGIIQLGYANIRINDHGSLALAYHQIGKIYRAGEKLSTKEALGLKPGDSRQGQTRYAIVLSQVIYAMVNDEAKELQISAETLFRKFVMLGLLALEYRKKPDSALIVREGGRERKLEIL